MKKCFKMISLLVLVMIAFTSCDSNIPQSDVTFYIEGEYSNPGEKCTGIISNSGIYFKDLPSQYNGEVGILVGENGNVIAYDYLYIKNNKLTFNSNIQNSLKRENYSLIIWGSNFRLDMDNSNNLNNSSSVDKNSSVNIIEKLPFLLNDEVNSNDELHWGTITNSGMHFKNLPSICNDKEVEVNIVKGSVYGNPDSLNILYNGMLPLTSSGVSFNSDAARAARNVISSGDEYMIVITGKNWSMGTTNNEFWRMLIQGFNK